MPTEAEPVVVIEGDCLDVLPQLAAGSVHMVWTDPPYGHGNMEDDLQAARIRDSVKGGRTKAAEPIINDGAEEMRKAVDAMLVQAVRILDADCCCCCCCCCGGGGPAPTFAWTASRLDRQGLGFFHAVIWDKSARGDGMGWRYRRNYEFVMVSHRKGGKLRWNENHPAIANVMYDAPVRDREHPNQKPASLIRRFIRAHTQSGDLILDPFAGSGTTGVAAIATGRRAILIEKEPKYAEICRRRIAEAMGRGKGSLFTELV